MATAQAKHHDYHLVDPSPWPIVGAISAFIMAVGAIGWMHHMYAAAPIVFGVGTIGVLYTMASWWGDVIREAQFKGDHTRVVQISHRYGMILFIASEVMFFVAWFWAFFNSALFPADAIHATRDAVFGCGAGTAMGACSVPGTWPPKGIETFDPWHLPLLNTLLLLTSGTTVTWAHHALLEGDRKGLKYGLILTVVARRLLHRVQAYEYAHAAFAYLRQHVRRDLLHGDRLPRLPRADRHRVPAGLPVPRLCRALHADPASRLRIRRLVLALRRRGVVVPVRLHLCLVPRRGIAGARRALNAGYRVTRGRPQWPPLLLSCASHKERTRDATLCGKRAMPDETLPTLTESAMRGIACRCPRCGKGKLYAGFIDLRPNCEACGLDYAFIDAGDGPAIFIIMIAGAIVVGAALIVEVKYQPPFWLHAALWLPLILATTLLPLRSMKSLLIALQFHHKAAPGRLIDREPK